MGDRRSSCPVTKVLVRLTLIRREVKMIRGMIAVLVTALLAGCGTLAEQDSGVIGKWMDHKWGKPVTIYRSEGRIFMTDAFGTERMERVELSNPSFANWFALAIVDRIGAPDNIFAISPRDGRLYYFGDCEFGDCNLMRVMEKALP